MFCTTNLVYITRQRSASQFSGAAHVPWLSHGGTRSDHMLARIFSSSHTLFFMQREARQKAGRSGAPCCVIRGLQHNPWGALASLKAKPLVPSTQQTHYHPSFFLLIFFLLWRDIFLLKMFCPCTGKKRLDWLCSPTWRYKYCRFQECWKTALDLNPEASFKPTTQAP